MKFFASRIWRRNSGFMVKLAVTQRRASSLDSPFFRVSEEVQAAIEDRAPVVALETTIYTHGFPYPENVKLAADLESLVRKHGAIPATIGVLNGVARVGITSAELNELTASAGKHGTRKLSRRDLAYICGLGYSGQKLNGGTTISGTMVLAHMAGVKILATGGLGGVHRGGEKSMDISADLTELGRTPISVISSGCKSFLDIPRTLEFLETQGVGVGTFSDGRKGDVDFPAFWTRESGIPSPLTIKDEKEAAAIIYAQSTLGLSSGLLFASPISAKFSIPKEKMDIVIAQALQDADKVGATGKDNTPFVLSRIRELTHGDTVTANRFLIEENVIRGTRIAVQLATLEIESHRSPDGDARLVSASAKKGQRIKLSSSSVLAPNSNVTSSKLECLSYSDSADVIVAGALAVDLSCDFDGNKESSISPQLETSNPATITQTLGGVGQNIATALHYLGTSVRLCSIVADDVAGSSALAILSERGLSSAGIKKIKNGLRTAQYVAVNNAQRELVLAMADMKILERILDFDISWKSYLSICKPRWLVVDANWDESTLHKWIVAGRASGAMVAYEPVSVEKSKRLFAQGGEFNRAVAAVPHHIINLATPNSMELASMYTAAKAAELFERDDWWQVMNAMGLSSSGARDRLVATTNAKLVDEGVPQQSIQLLPFIPSIATKLGRDGILLTQLLSPGDDRLTSSAFAQYILCRSNGRDHSDVVGGVYMRLFRAAEQVPEAEIRSVNGVGDTFLGVVIAGLARKNPKALVDLIDIAQRGSVMTLRSKEAVSPKISTLCFS
ncbi:hypothetical protein MMC22_001330 [Lobaria immixta]|nr:hypothetical protein [Lobaria immixta]